MRLKNETWIKILVLTCVLSFALFSDSTCVALGSLESVTELVYASTPPTDIAPEILRHTFSDNGREYTLNLVNYSIRGEHFEVLEERSGGELIPFTPSVSRTYFGTVEGDPYSSAAAIVMADGSVHARVYFERGATLFVVNDKVVQRRGWGDAQLAFPALSAVQYAKKPHTDEVYSFTLAIDASYDYYKSFSSTQEVFDYIEFSVAAVHYLYVRDAMLEPLLGRVLIRTEQQLCPYEGLDQGPVLSTLRNIWQAKSSEVSFTNVAYVSKRWAGMAYMPGIASINSGGDGYFDVVFRHELGHNWGAADWHAGSSTGGVPEGKTIMCGNAFSRISGPVVHTMLQHRDGYFRDRHLKPAGLQQAVSYPPYAMLSLYEIKEGSEAFEIDPTENDHDANGDEILLVSFDKLTAGGLSIGTSENGLPLIEIGDSPYGTRDHFFYEIENSRGLRDRGIIYFQVIPPYELIPRERLSIAHVSSQQTGSGNATNAIDGDLNTIWHSQWGDNPPPHEIVLEVDSLYTIGGIEYTPRQSGSNGHILQYEIYVSLDGVEWGAPLVSGDWDNNAGVKNAYFPELVEANFIKLRSLAGTNNNSSAANIGIWFMPDVQDEVSLKQANKINTLKIERVSSEKLYLQVPQSGSYRVQLFSFSGRVILDQEYSLSAGLNSIPLARVGALQPGLITVNGNNLSYNQKILIK